MSELVAALVATFGQDNTQREAASRWLDSAKATDLNGFLTALAGELANTDNQPEVRQAAGLQLKNSLSGQHDNVSEEDVERWGSLHEDVRNTIKQACVATLGTEQTSPSTAASVISIIAIIEVPRGLWGEVVEQLLSLIAGEASEALKVAVLEAVGYITEGIAEIDISLLQKDANVLLTNVIRCLSKDEPSARVQHAAAKCLLGSLEFCKANFDSEDERNVIMQVVCEATQLPDTRVKVAALECLVAIVDLYYKYMETYFGAALFHITMEAMADEDDNVILQGMEFWSTVAERERDLDEDAEHYQKSGQIPPVVSKHYTLGALPHIVPGILKLLAKQDETDDEDDWTVAKGANICLTLLAVAAKDMILELALPFIQENIQAESWQFRDAAVMAFCAVIQGASEEACTPLIEQALPPLVTLMHDPSEGVRDSVAYLLGQFFNVVPECALRPEHVGPILEALSAGLQMEARVASNCCWALCTVVESAHQQQMSVMDDESDPSNVISPHFEGIVGSLFAISEREDASEANFKLAVYESLMGILGAAPDDCYPTLQKAMSEIMTRLQQTLSVPPSRDTTELQAMLCATISTLLKKLSPDDVMAGAEGVAQVLVALLEIAYASQSNNVQEEALMTCGALLEGLGQNAAPIVESLRPHIISGLRNVEDYRVCFAAVTVTGDVFRQLGEAALPYSDEFMTNLFENLTNQALDRSVKPHILSTFGDISLAIGLHFQQYLDVCVGILSQATIAAGNPSVTNPDDVDYDAVDETNELRAGCLEAYTGIIQALKGDGDVPNPAVEALSSSIEHMIGFITKIISDQYLDDSCIRLCCGIIGDLCEIFGPRMAPIIPLQFINALEFLASNSEEKKTKKLGHYVRKTFNQRVLQK